ncbi:hypothetical protein [Rhizohabitans arisaemae]|uniref:hypothetical protein n=1 Tax=Rhizohabitans arisaemae TaxID=2720610 RepID=UPI0024B18D66|nr:hypothetical protein [Rhizohabitans arisaemae]
MSEAIAGHAEILRADARALAECAERLDAIEARLQESGVAPPWLRDAVRSHRAACVRAADDLTDAAADLDRYARGARRRPAPEPR